VANDPSANETVPRTSKLATHLVEAFFCDDQGFHFLTNPDIAPKTNGRREQPSVRGPSSIARCGAANRTHRTALTPKRLLMSVLESAAAKRGSGLDYSAKPTSLREPCCFPDPGCYYCAKQVRLPLSE